VVESRTEEPKTASQLNYGIEERRLPKTVPEPDAVSKPFWDSVDQKKLRLQYCTTCNRFQYPVRVQCFDCGKADNLTWREVQGRGHILETMVVHDTRVVRRKIDVPFNVALDEAPYINFLSNLPGVQAHQAPQGAPVELIFEELQGVPGRYIHEWKVMG
jgi:uncharacterized OB-fold protein